jgi:hypothetical protein
MVLDGSMHSMLLLPFFWMIQLSGMLLESTEELMIVNSN